MAEKGMKNLRKVQKYQKTVKICPMSKRKMPENEPNQCMFYPKIALANFRKNHYVCYCKTG